MRQEKQELLKALYEEYSEAQETRITKSCKAVYNLPAYLKKQCITISEYRWIPDICNNIQLSGEAYTICKGIADYFERHGFSVIPYESGFKISCDN